MSDFEIIVGISSLLQVIILNIQNMLEVLLEYIGIHKRRVDISTYYDNVYFFFHFICYHSLSYCIINLRNSASFICDCCSLIMMSPSYAVCDNILVT